MAGELCLRGQVQSRRPKLESAKSEREKFIDANFLKLQKWKKEFEQKNGRPPTKADLMLADTEYQKIAARLGEF